MTGTSFGWIKVLLNKLWGQLNPYQKINHFPGTYEITRKDKLAINIKRMQILHSKEEFNIAPETYSLPDEYSEFYK